ncbi:Protein boule-like isoform 2 [Schistosoma japonicum]|uniref:Protein boule-like isoform 2 n=1 Tax=Schistosoma japonicum TaxID=6182 RepID=A0A4Z2DGF6_SCHJA|nr:Protein boule-like [Schistosoma japonicum]TNN15310.1 Protein boule-like isoform 2 [Schistosoma japonicum]
MSGINIQPSDHVNRLISETALIPFCHSLTAGSSNPPKFGTLIPNRIFVGGIPSNTTEQELKSFFSSFGQVKDVKIINDRVGVSKGSYGFVTFESQEMAEKIIRDESETLVFKDRKLNIGHAIRKQQMFPRPDLTTALFFTGGTIPYTFQNGMAIFPLPSQEYPILAQTATPYATMMLPQLDGGTTLYLPPSLHSTTPVPGSAYTHVSQHAVTAALQQQLHQTGLASALTPAVVGQITALSSSLNNTRHQSQSTTTVIPAAAAAMAAAVQWPQQPVNNNQQTSQQPSTIPATHSISQSSNDQSTNLVTSIAQQQTVAANAAQHPINWRWSPGMQQPQNTFHGTNPQSSICTINTSSNTGVITSLSTISTPNLQFHQQVSNSTLSLLQPSFDALPSALQLLQNSTLTALFAAAMGQSNANIFNMVNNMNFDMINAVTPAALPTVSKDSSLINAEEAKYNITKESEKSVSFKINDTNDTQELSLIQPTKKPRYDMEIVQKVEKDK